MEASTGRHTFRAHIPHFSVLVTQETTSSLSVAWQQLQQLHPQSSCMHEAHPVTSRQQIESCTPTINECSDTAAGNVSGIGIPPEKPCIAHRALINMRFKAMPGLKKQSRMTTCIERELVTGNEIPRIAAHSCIKEASIGKRIVQAIEAPHSSGHRSNHRAT
jgi:hypothetical protein